MLIKKIRLVNFKNFEDVTVELNDFNVLVGANAAGKTNFIQALKFLRDIQEFGLENAIQLQGGIEYLRNIQLQNKKNTTLEFLFDGAYHNSISDGKYEIKCLQFEYKIEIANTNRATIKKEEVNYFSILKNEKDSSVSYNFNFSHKKHRNKCITVTDLKEKLGEKLFNKYSGEIEFFFFNPINFIHESESILFNNRYVINPNYFNYQVFDFDLKKAKQPATITGKVELEENAENLAIVLKKILEDDEKLQRFINILKDTLSYIDDVNINKFDKNLLLSVKEVYNLGTPMPSSLLSDGTISIVAMIIALFFENKPMAIFEEPEKGIHPALIGKLVNLFYDASRNKQIFITTHNPEILKYTQLNDLLLISRNDRGFSEISKPAEKEMVKSFLANELGIDQLFTQNLLEI